MRLEKQESMFEEKWGEKNMAHVMESWMLILSEQAGVPKTPEEGCEGTEWVKQAMVWPRLHTAKLLPSQSRGADRRTRRSTFSGVHSF